jgi:hypothetical protein
MPRNEDFFEVFGLISVQFATLDVFVTLSILRLVAHDQRVKKIAMNNRTTLGQKIRIIQRLESRNVVKHDVLVQLHQLLPTALILSEKRNRFIHDLWLFDPEAVWIGKITRLTIEQLPNWKFAPTRAEEHSLDSLREFVNEIGSMQKSFAAILEKLPLEA